MELLSTNNCIWEVASVPGQHGPRQLHLEGPHCVAGFLGAFVGAQIGQEPQEGLPYGVAMEVRLARNLMVATYKMLVVKKLAKTYMAIPQMHLVRSMLARNPMAYFLVQLGEVMLPRDPMVAS